MHEKSKSKLTFLTYFNHNAMYRSLVSQEPKEFDYDLWIKEIFPLFIIENEISFEIYSKIGN